MFIPWQSWFWLIAKQYEAPIHLKVRIIVPHNFLLWILWGWTALIKLNKNWKVTIAKTEKSNNPTCLSWLCWQLKLFINVSKDSFICGAVELFEHFFHSVSKTSHIYVHTFTQNCHLYAKHACSVLVASTYIPNVMQCFVHCKITNSVEIYSLYMIYPRLHCNYDLFICLSIYIFDCTFMNVKV